MSHIFQLLFLLSLIALSWNLTTKLDNFEQFCTWKQLEKGMSLSGNYIISGFNELDVIAMVFTPGSKMIYKNEKNKEGKFDIQIEEDGEYRLCFRSTDRQEKYVSFDFHVSGKEDQGKAVTTKQVDEMNDSVKKVANLFRALIRNQHFQSTRDNVYSSNIRSLERKIHWSTVFKIFVLIIIAGSQMYILTRLLKKKSSIRV